MTHSLSLARRKKIQRGSQEVTLTWDELLAITSWQGKDPKGKTIFCDTASLCYHTLLCMFLNEKWANQSTLVK